MELDIVKYFELEYLAVYGRIILKWILRNGVWSCGQDSTGPG